MNVFIYHKILFLEHVLIKLAYRTNIIKYKKIESYAMESMATIMSDEANNSLNDNIIKFTRTIVSEMN